MNVRLSTLISSCVLTLLPAAPGVARAETLTMSDAIARGLDRYQSLTARKHELRAAEARATGARDAYLPDLTAAAQQSFGTVNGAFGPQTPIGLYGATSAGPTAADQSWNAAFGANYLVATNWEVFAFGRISSRIDHADAGVRRAQADLEQERFVHGVRIAGAYLDLLVAQRVERVAASNLERADAVRTQVGARSTTGLVPEVDRSMSDAELSRAKLAVVDARDRAQQLATQLAIYLDAPAESLSLDASFSARAPTRFTTDAVITDNPQLKHQRAVVDEAEAAAVVAKRAIRPGLNLMGAYHARASGFDFDYHPTTGGYTTSYPEGIWPGRSNFVVGFTISWNLMSLIKNRGPSAAQEELAARARSDHDLTRNQLDKQKALADQRIENMRAFVYEVPKQYAAAEAAYRQKVALYDSGLTTFVDVQQALFALNRAEVDKSVAYVGLWQALLQKAASTGDFELFVSQARSP